MASKVEKGLDLTLNWNQESGPGSPQRTMVLIPSEDHGPDPLKRAMVRIPSEDHGPDPLRGPWSGSPQRTMVRIPSEGYFFCEYCSSLTTGEQCL
ncbi:hypothetical protein EYF80_024011 [Liparis tanakae]|uniref:Uncharacterized protein n=1 Tax=Liparis tanakae TaxID=230148 RepID=A0A4Z2HIT1_9TELE|nr:hypothetical protein EYF80_024011 [Liparis tanakae]